MNSCVQQKHIRNGFMIIDLFSWCFQVTIVDNVMQVIDLNLSDRNSDPLILANYNGVEDTVDQWLIRWTASREVWVRVVV